ncbi:MAG: ABC transporter ATP-binding protein [Anaerolineales bacterium]
MTTLTLHNLTKSYAGRRVIDGLSLEVADGQITALLGPSGSGKSTILKMIAGLETPDGGDIRLDGSSLLGLPPQNRSTVLMFQKAYLFPFISVGENIAFGLRARRLPKAHIQAEVTRMLALIGLPGVANRRPASLSGGEQQRIALARALVVQPRLLLLDEPLSSLDTAVRRELQAAIRDIQRQTGITTILVTHDLDEAMAVSDRMALLLHGHVAAYDRPNVLFQHPPCVETARFVGVNAFWEGEAAQGWLQTPFGRVRIPDETARGPQVYAIRPEHIGIQPQDGENAIPGVVRSCLYRGAYLEVQVQVSVGEKTVRVHLPGNHEPLSAGERVYVHLPAAHLFPVAPTG